MKKEGYKIWQAGKSQSVGKKKRRIWTGTMIWWRPLTDKWSDFFIIILDIHHSHGCGQTPAHGPPSYI